MDWQSAFNVAFSVAAAALGYMFRDTLARMDQLAKDMTAFRVEAAKSYVTREDHGAFMREIRESLVRIENKLDHKVDKS